MLRRTAMILVPLFAFALMAVIESSSASAQVGFQYRSPGYHYRTPTYSYRTPNYSYRTPIYSYRTPIYNYRTPIYGYRTGVIPGRATSFYRYGGPAIVPGGGYFYGNPYYNYYPGYYPRGIYYHRF